MNSEFCTHSSSLFWTHWKLGLIFPYLTTLNSMLSTFYTDFRRETLAFLPSWSWPEAHRTHVTNLRKTSHRRAARQNCRARGFDFHYSKRTPIFSFRLWQMTTVTVSSSELLLLTYKARIRTSNGFSRLNELLCSILHSHSNCLTNSTEVNGT